MAVTGKKEFQQFDILTAADTNAFLVNDPNPNVIINGGFDFWQRGTSFSGASAYYADRWTSSFQTVTTATVTRDTSVPTPQFSYSMKVVPGSNGTATEWVVRHIMERNNVQHLAGQSAVLSFWFKSSKTGAHKTRLITNTLGTGGIDSTVSFSIDAVNTWQYVTIQSDAFIPVTALGGTPTGIGVYLDIGFANNTALTTSDYFYITGVQLERGTGALPFRRAGGTIQGELAACQRYYYRMGGNTYEQFGIGFTTNALNTQSRFYVKHPVTMRSNPSSMDYSTLAIYDGTTVLAVSAAAMNSGQTGKDAAWVEVTNTASAINRGQALIANNSTSAYLGFNAEL